MRPKWTISVDLDGVLCRSVPPDKYASAQSIPENIEKVNKLFDKGWRIVIYTARGWFQYDMTEDWLKRHNVKYSQLVMGKVFAMMYIDDLNATLDEALEKDI